MMHICETGWQKRTHLPSRDFFARVKLKQILFEITKSGITSLKCLFTSKSLLTSRTLSCLFFSYFFKIKQKKMEHFKSCVHLTCANSELDWYECIHLFISNVQLQFAIRGKLSRSIASIPGCCSSCSQACVEFTELHWPLVATLITCTCRVK